MIKPWRDKHADLGEENVTATGCGGGETDPGKCWPGCLARLYSKLVSAYHSDIDCTFKWRRKMELKWSTWDKNPYKLNRPHLSVASSAFCATWNLEARLSLWEWTAKMRRAETSTNRKSLQGQGWHGRRSVLRGKAITQTHLPIMEMNRARSRVHKRRRHMIYHSSRTSWPPWQ